MVPQAWPPVLDHALQYIAAEFALGHRFDGIEGKLDAQQVFQLQLLHFALQLLRALLGPAFEVLDLFLHRGDGLVLLHYLELEASSSASSFGLSVRTSVKPVLHAFFDGEFQFTLGIVQFALFL